MVDVGGKLETRRLAVASAIIAMEPSTLELIREGNVKKGDVLSIARTAGVMGSKKTSELIPLCHPVRVDGVEIEFDFLSASAIRIEATVVATDRTGVEMEALTAVTVAGLTIYDMCKSVDRNMSIIQLQLEQKEGGKSGAFKRSASSSEIPNREGTNQ